MCHNAEAVEATRARFRPERITALFVGESAPASGDFFYYGNSALLGHMQRAVEQALGEGGDFLKRFKEYGWYLDDLVLEPVDKLSPLERKAKCLDAQNSLADRIAKYQPLAIVTVLLRISDIVDAAAIAIANTPLAGDIMSSRVKLGRSCLKSPMRFWAMVSSPPTAFMTFPVIIRFGPDLTR